MSTLTSSKMLSPSPYHIDTTKDLSIEGWDCIICGTTNNLQLTVTKYDMKCINCFQNTYFPNSTTTFKLNDDPDDNNETHDIVISTTKLESYWQCYNCSAQNSPDLIECEWCETQKYYQSPKNNKYDGQQHQQQQQQHGNNNDNKSNEKKTQLQKSWDCTFCTFRNSNIFTNNCEICNNSNLSYSLQSDNNLTQNQSNNHFLTINERFINNNNYNISVSLSQSNTSLTILDEWCCSSDDDDDDEVIMTLSDKQKELLIFGYCRELDDLLIMPNISLSNQTKEMCLSFYEEIGKNDDNNA